MPTAPAPVTWHCPSYGEHAHVVGMLATTDW
jgi:hypothetical protein